MADRRTQPCSRVAGGRFGAAEEEIADDAGVETSIRVSVRPVQQGYSIPGSGSISQSISCIICLLGEFITAVRACSVRRVHTESEFPQYSAVSRRDGQHAVSVRHGDAGVRVEA